MTLRMLFFLAMLSMVYACKKKEPQITTPEAAKLLFPTKNEPCLTGVVISATSSSVAFGWEAAKNAESYELMVKNLLTNSQTSQITSDNRADVILDRNTPYAWQIVSRSSNGSASTKSEVWRLYNSGPGIFAYAPYPAEATSPTHGQSLTVSDGKATLQWNSSDADNDVLNHDIYFGTVANPPLFKSDHVSSAFSVAVTSGNNYYWKIVTKDRLGNKSESSVFRFTIL